MPKYFFLCSGRGSGTSELTSFDNALLHSGIANYNVVKVSSILPANAIQKNKIDIAEGNILFTAYASKSTSKRGEIVSAAIAVGIPKCSDQIGVIMEFSDFCSKSVAEDKVKAMVVEAMNFRNYEISEILFSSAEAISDDGKTYVTAFAGLAMWE